MAVNWRLVNQIAKQYGIPPALFRRLVRQESGGNPRAQSPAGAQGLTQLMPATARGLGVTDPFNPQQNLTGGAKYLAQQRKKFGRWDLALSAYNSGPGGSESSGRVEGYAETKNYVKAILAGLNLGGGTAASAPPPGAPAAPKKQGVSPVLASIFNQNNELLGVPGIDLTALRRTSVEPGVMLPRKRLRPTGGARGGGDPLTTLRGLAKRHGLTVSSADEGNPGDGVHTPTSWHYKSRAVDVVGTDAQLRRLSAQVRRNPGRYREFFWDKNGWYVKNGRIVKGRIGGHGDHAHIAI